MTVFYEHLKDQEAYIKQVLSEKLPMIQLSSEEFIRHVSSKQCTQCDTIYSKRNLKLDITTMKLEPTLNHTVINAIFNSNIRGEEHLLKIVNKEKMQRKESLLTKLLEINSIRNGQGSTQRRYKNICKSERSDSTVWQRSEKEASSSV